MSASVIIPARWGSTRLPGKALADLAGVPMVVRVAERAAAAEVGPVWVATDDARIEAAVEQAGFSAVRTGVHASGTDRVAEAAARLDLAGVRTVVNLQGDEPLLDPEDLRVLVDAHQRAGAELATLARAESPPLTPDSAQVWLSRDDAGAALDFWRGGVKPASGLAHVGVYAYTPSALDAFAGLPVHPREMEARLEQLRALAHGWRIQVAMCRSAGPSLGVDTPEDLRRVRAMLARAALRRHPGL